jgi:hypothetical protein
MINICSVLFAVCCDNQCEEQDGANDESELTDGNRGDRRRRRGRGGRDASAVISGGARQVGDRGWMLPAILATFRPIPATDGTGVWLSRRFPRWTRGGCNGVRAVTLLVISATEVGQRLRGRRRVAATEGTGPWLSIDPRDGGEGAGTEGGAAAAAACTLERRPRPRWVPRIQGILPTHLL